MILLQLLLHLPMRACLSALDVVIPDPPPTTTTTSSLRLAVFIPFSGTFDSRSVVVLPLMFRRRSPVVVNILLLPTAVVVVHFKYYHNTDACHGQTTVWNGRRKKCVMQRSIPIFIFFFCFMPLCFSYAIFDFPFVLKLTHTHTQISPGLSMSE